MLLMQRFMRQAGNQPPPHRAAAATMDVEQARAVLGLEDAPLDTATVVDAHRRLMQRIHPDKGGSALLAQQLNEAKRVLLAHLQTN